MSAQSDLEAQLWARLWALPQAVEWARCNQEDEVALYCRRFIEAQEPGSAVNLSTLVRQMRDSLGLTTPGMRSNRWVIGPAESSAARRPTPTSPRRLKVVAPDAVEGSKRTG